MYIFELNHLSVASFAIIFSQSEGCLFILLIVSFAVQKLLSFIRSHLFIFVLPVVRVPGRERRLLETMQLAIGEFITDSSQGLLPSPRV